MGYGSEKDPPPKKKDINETPLSRPGDVMFMDEEFEVSTSSSNNFTTSQTSDDAGQLALLNVFDKLVALHLSTGTSGTILRAL